MRRLPSASIALLLLLAAPPVRAQDARTEPAAGAETPTDPATPTDPVTPTDPAGPTTAEPETAPTEPAPEAEAAEPGMPPAPPVMVVALATGRVPSETVVAVRDAIVAQIEPMTGGRPVLPLLAAELEAAIAACTEPACVGQLVASGGAVGAIVARLSRRAARGPIDVRIEMIDPVSGVARVEPIVYSLLPDADVAQSLGPLLEQLRPAMFSPPPPPPQIMVTVNVDGATVRIDDEVIGESPVASHQVMPGTHTVAVVRDGYTSFRRAIEADVGETERVDVTLQTLEAAGIDPRSLAGPEERGPEWYEHWGFWTGVGGAVLIGVIVGVAVGVSSSGQPGMTPDPQGIPLPPIL